MRLEQRIGRVDRIGQAHIVRVVNLVLEDTVEFRVREVLEEKLAVILREFGVDKTGDVLDSADASVIFDELYRDAILDPSAVETKVDSVLAKVRERAESMQPSNSLLAQTGSLNPTEAQRLLGHPLPYWIERMTANYLRCSGGEAEKGKTGWKLRWPDGHSIPSAVFTLADTRETPGCHSFDARRATGSRNRDAGPALRARATDSLSRTRWPSPGDPRRVVSLDGGDP